MGEIKTYQLEQQLSRKPMTFWEAKAYLFLGEEHFLKEELIAMVSRLLKLDRDSIQLMDAEVMDSRNIATVLETTSMDEYRKVVVIDNADHLDNDVCKDLYQMWDASGFPESVLPVFYAENVDARRQFWKLVKEEGVWCKFWPLFEDRIPQWIQGRFSMHSIKAAPGTEQALLDLCGNDLRKISREVEKLSLVYDGNITPEDVRFLVKKSTEASRYEVEDRFVNRDIVGTCTLIEEMREHISPRELLNTFTRYTRHALQAKHYVDRRETFALQLTELAKHVLALSNRKDWNGISKRNELVASAGALISGVPMTTKMIWTGGLPLNKEEAVTTEITTETLAQESEDSEDKKKKRKTKRDKLMNFDFDADKKKAEAEERKKRAKDLAQELNAHNIWAQKATIPFLKAFVMAAHYTAEELSRMLLDMTKILNEFGEDDVQRGKLEVVLMELRKANFSC